MKKVTTFALLGIQFALLAGAEESMNPQMRTFYERLDPEAQKQFLELDEEHRRAAMSIVDQYCAAVHECKGHRERSVQEQYDRQMHE